MRREGLDLDLSSYVDRRDAGERDLPDPYRQHIGRDLAVRWQQPGAQPGYGGAQPGYGAQSAYPAPGGYAYPGPDEAAPAADAPDETAPARPAATDWTAPGSDRA